MEPAEAEAILDGDRETAVALLADAGRGVVEANRRLEVRVAELERRLNASRAPAASAAASPGTRAGTGRCFRSSASISWSSTGRSAATAARMSSRRTSGSTQAAVQRHQVSQLPPVVVTVTEHRLHRLRRPACAAETRAELPAGVPRSAFDARLQAPLGIPSWSEDSESERVMCFTRVNIVDRQPPTTGLHPCFVAASREQVDASAALASRPDFAPTVRRATDHMPPGYYAAFRLDPDDNNIEALYRDVGNPGHVS